MTNKPDKYRNSEVKTSVNYAKMANLWYVSKTWKINKLYDGILVLSVLVVATEVLCARRFLSWARSWSRLRLFVAARRILLFMLPDSISRVRLLVVGFAMRQTDRAISKLMKPLSCQFSSKSSKSLWLKLPSLLTGWQKAAVNLFGSASRLETFRFRGPLCCRKRLR